MALRSVPGMNLTNTQAAAQVDAEADPGGLERRPLARLGRTVSTVGLGCWQLGGDWGDVNEADAMAVLDAAAANGVTFFDTADVYGDGLSERLIGRFLDHRPEGADPVFVATKTGRRADPFEPASFTDANLRAWIDRSRSNLGVDTLDLVQLHCPPTPVYSDDAVFDVLDALVGEGRIGGYGVSVETCAEALSAIARPGVASVQIIFNAFRLKPLDEVLPAARAAGVGIIARVPLASGLLSGKYSAGTTFGADDHRTFNRHGQAFDVGETFSGVDYETGLAAVEELRSAVPDGWTLPEAALRWIIDQDGVTSVIPGARNPGQAEGNARVGRRGPVGSVFGAAVREVYDKYLRADIHPRW